MTLTTEERKEAKRIKKLKKWKSLLQFFWVSFSIVGLLALLWFSGYLFVDGYTFWKKGANLANTGAVGDFIGGVVGTLWAFASVLLFNLSLMLQREELELTRKIMIESNGTQEETKIILKEQLKNLEYRTRLEALSNLIIYGNKTIKELKKGVYDNEDAKIMRKIKKDISKARLELSRLSNEIIDK